MAWGVMAYVLDSTLVDFYSIFDTTAGARECHNSFWYAICMASIAGKQKIVLKFSCVNRRQL